MLTKLKISEKENMIYFEVDECGLFHVSLRNGNDELIFEKVCWEMTTDVQYTISTTNKIVSPELQINPSYPIITTEIDYESNKIFINSAEELELKIKIYDTFTNKIIWRNVHKFDGRRIWFSPPEKLVKYGELLVVVKDKFSNTIYTNHIQNNRYVFCHIPKTAGTSIKKVLRHRTNSLKHLVFDKEKSNTFSFAFVRNPYDRFLSSYFFLVSGGLGEKQKIEKIKYIGEEDDIDKFIKTNLINSLEQEHLKPQNEYIPNGVDYLGKVENIQQDFDRICQILGIEPIELPHENKTQQYSYQLTEEQKEIIYQIYKEDFERFGYSK